MIDWQPIDTAPRDGTLILLGCESDPPPPEGHRIGSIYPTLNEHLFFVSLGWYNPLDKTFVNALTDGVYYHASHWAPVTSPILEAIPAFYSLAFLKRNIKSTENSE